jgi:hypothetical protein
MMSPTTKLHIQLDPERKHRRDRLVLVTQTQFVLLKALHPIKTPPKTQDSKKQEAMRHTAPNHKGQDLRTRKRAMERVHCNGNEKYAAKGLIYNPSDIRKAVIGGISGRY